MKKGLLKVFVLSCLLTFFSCDDKEDSVDMNTASEANLYGRAYALTSGVIWENSPNNVTPPEEYVYTDNYEDESGKTVSDKIIGFTAGDTPIRTGNYSISLYESGITFDETLKKSIGSGLAICFHFASEKETELVAGTYKFSENKKPLTFVGYVSSEYISNPDSDQNVVPAKLTEGTVTITRNAGNYKITFNCKTSFGGSLSGSYEGALKPTSVKQSSSVLSLSDIKLDGLFDLAQQRQVYLGQVYPSSPRPDFNGGESFLYIQAGSNVTAKDAQSNKDNIDIALKWNEEDKAFYFKAPIFMRSYLKHMEDYTFTCHTKYMNAPASFTEENFNNLKKEDLAEKITEEVVKIETESFAPKFIFFETGKGLKGVIRVKSYTPSEWYVKQVIISGVYYIEELRNPSLNIDVKCFTSPTVASLR